MPSKHQLDQQYNFACPGCLKRRNKRASHVVAGTRYCKACHAVIVDDQMPEQPRMLPIEDYEKRWQGRRQG